MLFSRRSTTGEPLTVVASTANMGSLNTRVRHHAHTLKGHMRKVELNILTDTTHPAIECAMHGRVSEMICQCEICKKTYPSGYDATKLAVLMGRLKEYDLGRFIVCKDCYNDIERAIANAWLTPIKD
jgi:chemotaxis protein histidine kinase CheA